MSKVLVCFFSTGGEDVASGENNELGNTAVMAQLITDKLKEDSHEVTSFRIEPSTPYPDGYDQKLARAMEERSMQERPEFVGEIPDFDNYDTVFIGYPIWCSDLPMIMYTFLEKHVFTGKIVIPFCTHGGSGESGTFQTVQEKAVGSAPGEGLAMLGDLTRKPGGKLQVDHWVEQLAV